MEYTKILYCRIGWMNSYKGINGDSIINGGSYNQNNIGFEIYNFLGVNGKYYGFVEPGINCSIHVERLGASRRDDFAENILVVWIARGNSKGQRVIGWYKNASVYRNLQSVPEEVLETRDLKDHVFFNVYSDNVTLIAPEERKLVIYDGIGQKNIWYGDDETNRKILEYINSYEEKYDKRIVQIENNTKLLEGEEREAVVKTRVNQDVFRKELLQKYSHCCLCPVNNEKLLVASHIKPWSVSDKWEKLDVNNGLLLCPNHDRAFDAGYISFADDGRILISDELDDLNRAFLNLNTNMQLDVTEDNLEYIRYHRNTLFHN